MFSDFGHLYLEAFCPIAIVCYIYHLVAPYGFRNPPDYDDRPDPFLVTFTRGQLAEYLLRCLVIPALYAVAVCCGRRYGTVCAYIGAVCILGCIRLGFKIRYRLDGVI